MAKQPTKSKIVPPANEIEDVMQSHSIDAEAANVASSQPKNIQQRNMTGKKEIFTDLFKLRVEKVIKYEGWDEQNEHPNTHPNKFSTWEHTHPFRTFDKKGDKMNHCTPIGGHFHMVEWDDNGADGVPTIKSVSGPMVMSKKRIRGELKTVPVPANDYDDHTHDVEYIRSCKIETSTTNIEAAKVMAYEASKTAPLSGVEVR
jgi:hypothetical protein